MPAESSSWRVAAATSIGTSHLRDELPCQDFSEERLLKETDGTEILVVTVADGAGSAAHADIGSWLACSTLQEEIELFLSDGGKIEQADREVSSKWLAAVRAAIQARADVDGNKIRDYACTLLAAAVSNTAAVFFQIGDGAIVVAEYSNDEWGYVFWPQRGEFANTTFFITDDEALDRFEHEVESRYYREVSVFTDGIEPLVLHYATKSVHNPFFAKMFPLVRKTETAGLDSKLSASLKAYLSSPAVVERTDDDKSLVLATRRSDTMDLTNGNEAKA